VQETANAADDDKRSDAVKDASKTFFMAITLQKLFVAQ
jgi:hypothetical protein